MKTREQEEQKMNASPLDPIFRMAKQMSALDSLNDIKEATDIAVSGKFFSYKKDEKVPGGYNIFINGEPSHSVKFPEADNTTAIEAYIEISELSFKAGCAFILNHLVDKLVKRESEI
jgi:hypothetical protein